MSDKATGFITVKVSDWYRVIPLTTVYEYNFVSSRWIDLVRVDGRTTGFYLGDDLRAELHREGIPIPGEKQETPKVETPKDEWVLAIDCDGDGRLYVGGDAVTYYLTPPHSRIDRLRVKCDRVVYVDSCGFAKLSNLTILREEKP